MVARVTTVSRFWLPADANLDPQEAAQLAEYGLDAAAAQLATLETLTKTSCAILLGAPGAGKSTEMARLQALLTSRGESVTVQHLGDFTEQASLRNVFHEYDSSALVEADDQAFLILDGWDESPLQARARTRLVTDGLGRLDPRVRVFITSRTAAWAVQTEQSLREVRRDLRTFQLAPLTRGQAEAISEERGVPPEVFWAYVQTTGTAALLGTPMLVEMIALEARAAPVGTGSLSQSVLFDRATLRMAGEPDPLRDAKYPGRDIQAGAGALAAFALLGGARAISLEDEVPASVLDARVLEGLEVRLGGSGAAALISLSRPLFQEVADSALCVRDAGGQFWFQSQSVAEFLAARTLKECGLPPTLIQSLIQGQGGLVPAQVQGLSAWLATLAPAEYGSLLGSDPFTFVAAGLELEDPALRRLLVIGILEMAIQRSLPSDVSEASLRALTYVGIVDDLMPYLSADQEHEVRYLVIRMIRANRLVECDTALAALVLDDDDDVWVRNSAAHALIDLRSPMLAEVSRGLLTGDSLANDEDDQLLGVGLLAGLESGERLSDLVPYLRFEGNPDFFGSLALVVSLRLPEAVQRLAPSDHGEIRRLLDWSETYERGPQWRQRPSHERRSGDLLDAILLLGAQAASSDAEIMAVVRRIVRQRLDEHRAFLFGSHFGWRNSMRVPVDSIRDLVAAAAPLLAGEHGRYSVYLVAKEVSVLLELPWLLEKASAADGEEAVGWARLVDWAIDPRNPSHLEAIAAMVEGTALYEEVAAHWIDRITRDRNGRLRVSDLDNDAEAFAAEQQQELAAWEASLRLALSDESEGAFGRVYGLLSQAPHLQDAQRSASDRLEDLPGFETLGGNDRSSLTELARRYLTGPEAAAARGAVIAELGGNRISYRSLWSVAALDWLSGKVPAEEMAAHLKSWGACLFHAPFDYEGDTGTELLSDYRASAPQEFEAMLAVALSGDRAQEILARASASLDESAQQLLWDIASSRAASRSVRCEAAATLTRLAPVEGLSMFESLWDARNHALAVAAAVRACSPDTLASTWAALRPRLARRRAFTADTMLQLASREQLDVASLPEQDVIWLWRRLKDLFPPSEDPVVHGVHGVSDRESLAHFRDRLLPSLARRGTVQAIKELQALKAEFPDLTWIGRLLADARRHLARETWSPLPVDLLRTLWADWESKVVVATSRDLLRVVTETLRGLQATIADEENPEATMLWNHRKGCKGGCRPKSEDDLNDYVARRLRERLPGRLILREVEVSRKSTSGIGQRVDLLIAAMTPQGDYVRVVIEGKGCWNREIRTAIPEQLVARYLGRYEGAAGLLLVYWFNPGHYREKLTWMSDALLGDKARLTDFVEAEAGKAMTDNMAMASQVLDASLDW